MSDHAPEQSEQIASATIVRRVHLSYELGVVDPELVVPDLGIVPHPDGPMVALLWRLGEDSEVYLLDPERRRWLANTLLAVDQPEITVAGPEALKDLDRRANGRG